MRVALVTAVFGGIDSLKPVPPQSVACDYHVFTEWTSPGLFPDLDDRMRAKFFKLQTHHILSQYDAYIWIDGSVEVTTDKFVEQILRYMPLYGVTLNKHPFRKGIVEEAAFITDGVAAGNPYLSARYAPAIIDAEVKFCLSEGYKDDWGLYECGIFARPNNARVNAFFDAWWEHCLKWSCFDQNAFPYLAWREQIDIIPFNNRDHFRLTNHGR